ncbi:MAG: nitrogenase component 1 [Phascolarctobacterium sp.]|nr:nitrogenase component 1 [Phascolarctobacterium sp.]
MKPLTSCALFGATRVFAGIKDAIILQHSVAGCNYGSLNFRYPSNMGDIRQASTIAYENNVIRGGADILTKGLVNADELYAQVKIIFVISGCIPNMIGDDVASIIEDSQVSKKVIHVNAPGYGGTMEEGTETALLALADLVKPHEKSSGPSINILGIFTDDPEAMGDILALEEALNKKVKINFNTCMSCIEDVEHISRAHLNIYFGYGEALAQVLQRKFGTDYLVCDYPYGIHGMENFLNLLAEKLNVDFTEEIAELNAQGEAIARLSVDYLQNIYQLPAFLIVDKARFSGLKKFVTEELGMYLSFAKTNDTTDVDEIKNALNNSLPALLCGSSFLADLSREYQVPLVRLTYPVTDEVSITRTGFLGVRGTAHFLEKVINASLQMTYKKDSLFPKMRKECSDED